MARSHWHRLTACLLLTIYSVATIAGGLLHHHDHETEHKHGEHCQHRYAGGQHLAGVEDEHDDFDHGTADHGDFEVAPGTLAITSESGHSLFDDGCSACRFVGQRTLPAHVGSAGTISTHSVELALRYTSQSGISIARTLHSRAPPSRG